MDPLADLLARQSGVVARWQLLELHAERPRKERTNATDRAVAKRIRRREWATVHEGVYVDHTGELTWLQEAWAAVRYAWPAVLCHTSALRAAEGPGRRDVEDGPIHVAVCGSRRVRSQPGMRVHRSVDLDDRVQWNRSPPSLRYEEAVLDVAASARDDLAAIAVLSRAVQSRRTTAQRMVSALSKRRRVARRAWLSDVLEDVANGTCSVLEHGYLTLVERAHGLPSAERQKPDRGRSGRIYRDASYTEPLEVELDGRLAHGSGNQRESDYDRDLVTLVGGRVTARLTYGQVFARSCWTAAQIESLLHDRGWCEDAVRCGPDCRLRS